MVVRSVIYTDANFCCSYAFFGQVCVSSTHFEKCKRNPCLSCKNVTLWHWKKVEAIQTGIKMYSLFMYMTTPSLKDKLDHSWQCRQRDIVEATETLWSPQEDNLPHPVHLPGHELQNCPRRPAVWKFWGEDWSPAGVPAFTVPLPPGHRLDHEDHNNR